MLMLYHELPSQEMYFLNKVRSQTHADAWTVQVSHFQKLRCLFCFEVTCASALEDVLSEYLDPSSMGEGGGGEQVDTEFKNSLCVYKSYKYFRASN